jgi:hypothetical protein
MFRAFNLSRYVRPPNAQKANARINVYFPKQENATAKTHMTCPSFLLSLLLHSVTESCDDIT